MTQPAHAAQPRPGISFLWPLATSSIAQFDMLFRHASCTKMPCGHAVAMQPCIKVITPMFSTPLLDHMHSYNHTPDTVSCICHDSAAHGRPMCRDRDVERSSISMRGESNFSLDETWPAWVQSSGGTVDTLLLVSVVALLALSRSGGWLHKVKPSPGTYGLVTGWDGVGAAGGNGPKTLICSWPR